MANEKSSRLYIVMPSFGVRGQTLSQLRTVRALREVADDVGRRRRKSRRRLDDAEDSLVEILDEIRPDGFKLVRFDDERVNRFRARFKGIKLVPVQEYQTLRNRALELENELQAPAGPIVATSSIFVTDSSNTPVPGAKVIAMTKVSPTRVGVSALTDVTGVATLPLAPGTLAKRFLVQGPHGFWGASIGENVVLLPQHAIKIASIADAAIVPFHLTTYGGLGTLAGQGVRVGVIDAGIDGTHPALINVTGGSCHVSSELENDPANATDWGPSAIEPNHGTHVAGIIGAQLLPPLNIRGVAPGVDIKSYRVVAHARATAFNYDICSAIDKAVADGCDVINLSIGGNSDTDEALDRAIEFAAENGVLIICAAGNSSSAGVAYPASSAMAIAVSAFGRVGTYPPGSCESLEVGSTASSLPELFRAKFSPSHETRLDFGGPGVGIVSTVKGGGYAPMSGSSMAAPAVTGFAAHLLASTPTIAALGRSRARYDALENALRTSCMSPAPFRTKFIGSGIPGLT